MNDQPPLPPGQRETESFPRFGLTPFARRFPTETGRIAIQIVGDVRQPITIETELDRIPRVEQTSDFHCVTTWTHRALRWSGLRFSDFYSQILVPLAEPHPEVKFVVLYGQDGYRSILPLEDMLAPDVLLADRLDDRPLPIAHGAPLRLVAPAHYGYKSVKHVHRIGVLRSAADFRQIRLRFLVHPRARVAQEERGRWFPGWILRYLYRPLIRSTASLFERALRSHLTSIGLEE